MLFASCFLSVSSSGFRIPGSPKVGISDTFSVTFRGPGAHARTELSLQSQHDLAGSGRSKNRCVLLFPWGREKKGIWRGSFLVFYDLGMPKGVHGRPKWCAK